MSFQNASGFVFLDNELFDVDQVNVKYGVLFLCPAKKETEKNITQTTISTYGTYIRGDLANHVTGGHGYFYA